MGKETQARTAVFGRYGHAEQTHVAELAPQVVREHVLTVDQVRARRDFLLGEGVHALAEQVDFFTEGEWSHDGFAQCPRMRPRKRGPLLPMCGSLILPIAAMRSSAMRSAAL